MPFGVYVCPVCGAVRATRALINSHMDRAHKGGKR